MNSMWRGFLSILGSFSHVFDFSRSVQAEQLEEIKKRMRDNKLASWHEIPGWNDLPKWRDCGTPWYSENDNDKG